MRTLRRRNEGVQGVGTLLYDGTAETLGPESRRTVLQLPGSKPTSEMVQRVFLRHSDRAVDLMGAVLTSSAARLHTILAIGPIVSRSVSSPVCDACAMTARASRPPRP